jgi:hypothetical protein
LPTSILHNIVFPPMLADCFPPRFDHPNDIWRAAQSLTLIMSKVPSHHINAALYNNIHISLLNARIP